MQTLYKILAAVALCSIALYLTWNTHSHDHDEIEEEHNHEFVKFSPEDIKLHEIALTEAGPGNITQTAKAPARIVIGADSIAHVLPKAPGIAVSATKNLGQQVKAGELLATLDSKEMAEAKSDYLSALKKSEVATKTYQREKSLQEKNISSLQEFNAAEADYQSAAIDAQLAKQKLHALGLNDEEVAALPSAAPETLRLYEIRSPIDGQIISRHISIGELVPVDQQVYEVADLSKVWAEISLFSQDRPLIKEGVPLSVKSSGSDLTTDAHVIYLSPIIDPDTRTSTAIAEIENVDSAWLPGSFAQATLITDVIPVALIVPRDAIQNVDGNDSLFVTHEDGFAVKNVQLGKADDDFVEIIAGLTPGEEYASKNTFILKAELQKDEAEHMD